MRLRLKLICFVASCVFLIWNKREQQVDMTRQMQYHLLQLWDIYTEYKLQCPRPVLHLNFDFRLWHIYSRFNRNLTRAKIL